MCTEKCEHGMKLRRRSFGKTETNGEAWLLDNPQSGNIRRRQMKCKIYTYKRLCDIFPFIKQRNTSLL
jgi:hypothetical protein